MIGAVGPSRWFGGFSFKTHGFVTEDKQECFRHLLNRLYRVWVSVGQFVRSQWIQSVRSLDEMKDSGRRRSFETTTMQLLHGSVVDRSGRYLVPRLKKLSRPAPRSKWPCLSLRGLRVPWTIKQDIGPRYAVTARIFEVRGASIDQRQRGCYLVRTTCLQIARSKGRVSTRFWPKQSNFCGGRHYLSTRPPLALTLWSLSAVKFLNVLWGAPKEKMLRNAGLDYV